MEIASRNELVKLLEHYNLPKVVVEIGVAEGMFTEKLYRDDLDKLYLVDIWKHTDLIEGCANYPQGWHDTNLNRVKRLFGGKENVEILQGLSYKMAAKIPDNSCGLIYIDGDHSYEGVRTDMLVYWGKLVVGGILAFHDYGNPVYGVNKAVQGYHRPIELLKEDGEQNNLGCYIIK